MSTILAALMWLVTTAGPAAAQDDGMGCVPYPKNGELRGCKCATGAQDYQECRAGDEESCSYVASCFEEHFGAKPVLLPALRGDREALLAMLSLQEDAGREHAAGVALLVAAQTGQTALVRALLQAGAPVGARNLHDQTALELAMSTGSDRDSVVRALLDGGADPNAGRKQPLYAAVHRSDDALVAMLLEAGANPDSDNGQEGITVLMCAAMNGDLPLIRTLLEAKADPTRRSRRGVTAAQFAEQRGHAEAATLLHTAEEGAAQEAGR